MSTHERQDPRCGVCVRCELSTIRNRISRARRSSLPMSSLPAGGVVSGLVDIVERLLAQFGEILFDPRYAFIKPLIEADAIRPSERLAQLRAVQHVRRILA